MVDYAQLRNLDTSKLTTAAETAGSLSGAMTSRGGEVSSAAQIPPGMWAGNDATAASSLMSPLPEPLYGVGDSASQSQGVLDTLVGELQTAKSRLDDAHDLVGGTGITIGGDGTVTTPVVNDPAVAERNDQIAQQINSIITEAVQMANDADDAAVGSLASVGGFLAERLGPSGLAGNLGPGGYAAWGLGQGLGRFGNLASWMENSKLGRFAPRGPNGQFISPSSMSPLQRALAGANGKNFVANPGQAASRANWATAGKWAGRAGGVLAVGSSTASQLAQDWNDPNMGNVEKGGRAAYRGAVQGGAAWGGGIAGAKIGAVIGTAIAPGVGTVIGGAIGGIAGGVIGAYGGGAIVDHTVDAVGNAAEAVGNGIGNAAEAVGDGVSNAVEGAGKALDKITPW